MSGISVPIIIAMTALVAFWLGHPFYEVGTLRVIHLAYLSWTDRIMRYGSAIVCSVQNQVTTWEDICSSFLPDVALDHDYACLTRWVSIWKIKAICRQDCSCILLHISLLARPATTPKWHPQAKNPPETRNEVMTLSMSNEAMTKFTSDCRLQNVGSVHDVLKSLLAYFLGRASTIVSIPSSRCILPRRRTSRRFFA